jgi:hypothetical protein
MKGVLRFQMSEDTSSIEYSNSADKDTVAILGIGVLPPPSASSSRGAVVGTVSSILKAIAAAKSKKGERKCLT